MSAVERVQRWFEGGLIRPDAQVASTVHLSRALATLAGVPDPRDGPTPALIDAIGSAEHLVFVLADGLGMALLERLDEGCFLRRHLHSEMRAVFPAATASAVTSIATGRWPARHAVPGWWTYLPEHGLTATALPFIERFSGEPLEVRGLTTALYPETALMPRYTRACLAVQPEKIADSAYSRYFRGDLPTYGYADHTDAVDAVLAHVANADGPTFTYLYLPDVDHTAHYHGPGSEQVTEKMLAVNAATERLAGSLGAGSRLVLSADHGLVHVPADRKHLLTRDDPLLSLLVPPPSGEPRVPLFHVVPSQEQAFHDAFSARFGERWALLTVDEVEGLELFGPGLLAPKMRARLGTFVGLCEGVDVLLYRPGEAVEGTEKLVGYHGGLLPDEVRVPLVLA